MQHIHFFWSDKNSVSKETRNAIVKLKGKIKIKQTLRWGTDNIMSFLCEAFPVILQSAGYSGFLTNQENARVRGVTKSYVICYTRLFLRSSSSCDSHRLPSHLPADCISIRLFVFNLFLLSVWRIFYPHLSWRDFSFKCFQIKPSHLWPFIPNSCLSFVFLLFSSVNDDEPLWSSGYILTAVNVSQ